MKALLVGGTFDNHFGKPSHIIEQLAQHLDMDCINGGNVGELPRINFNLLDVLLWFPNIDNSEDKILPHIKEKNYKLLLVQSKRVIEKDYTESDVVGRLLASHANLGVMFLKLDNVYRFQLIDPLGNSFCMTTDIQELAQALNNRINHLITLTRINCTPLLGQPKDYVSPKPSDEFIEIIRAYGEQFTKFVNAVNPNRLLGNASTRCAKGFPAQRLKDRYLVSRRNVDKTTLSPDDFIEVKTQEERVIHIGNVKPSVDTPIQIRLFNYYTNVNYMIHGHVYVDGAPYTKSKIPCGYIEEFQEIKELYPSSSDSNFCVNLRGHGCLIMANDLDYFKNIKLIGRPFPELG
jgi:hypothetical protein